MSITEKWFTSISSSCSSRLRFLSGVLAGIELHKSAIIRRKEVERLLGAAHTHEETTDVEEGDYPDW